MTDRRHLTPVDNEPPFDPYDDTPPPTPIGDPRAPARDKGAEQAVLAALLDNPELGPTLQPHLTRDDKIGFKPAAFKSATSR